MKVLVTGASGYIGQRLVRLALAQGHTVIAATRRRPDEQIEWIPFDLFSGLEIRLPAGTDVVIHLAATTKSGAVQIDRELEAAQLLLKASARVGARLVFVSSQTARQDAPTAYGRAKFQIEQVVLSAGGWIVRPGLVYGGNERGLFGSLVAVVRAMPAIPAFLPSPKVQPIHVDDLAAALLACAKSNVIPPSVLSIGAREPVTFTKFLQFVSSGWVRRFRLSMPVPVVIVRLTSAAVGSQLRARLGLDRLTSLFDLPLMDTERDLRLLGLVLRPLSSGMTHRGADRRRLLIREGRAFTSYVLKVTSNSVLVRRYVRCMEALRGGQPLHIPALILHMPVSLALLDDPSFLLKTQADEFAWRLNAAVVLSEASVQGAYRFLAIGKRSGFIMALARVTRALGAEICWRILALALRPMLRRTLHHFAQVR